ncbi:hypothetical protein CFP56_025443 [Quercus suber]|uniref:Uncharacterized protein n=1 Tax=Quercus suber TaxID=58331 RepID=A0AAW0LXI1_QUESU
MSDSANLSKGRYVLDRAILEGDVLDENHYWNGVYTRRLSRGARLQRTPSCNIWCFKPINSSTQFQFNLHTSRQIKIMKPSRTNGSRFNLDIIPLELNKIVTFRVICLF